MAENNPLVVFMDISIYGKPAGSMTFELFKNVVPYAAENFRALCTGERGIGKYSKLPLHYKGSFFIATRKGGSYLEGVDFSSSCGTSGESIYKCEIPDEKPSLKCDKKGLLAHFKITLKPDEGLERFHIVFGKIVKGLKTFDKIKKASEVAAIQVMSDCGECNEDGSKIYSKPQIKKPKKKAKICSVRNKTKKARIRGEQNPDSLVLR